MNSFNLALSEKHFICPSILNDSFAGQSKSRMQVLAFHDFKYFFLFLLVWKVSFEKSADGVMGTPLQVTLCFSLAAFKILSLSLILVNVIIMCLGMFLLLGSDLPGLTESLFSLPDWGSFPSLCFQISFQFLAIPILLWHFYDLDVGTFKDVLEVPKPLFIFKIFVSSFCSS